MFLHINRNLAEEKKKKLLKAISLTIATKKIKHFRTNITKDGKNIYKENYKTLTKETEEHTTKMERPPAFTGWKN